MTGARTAMFVNMGATGWSFIIALLIGWGRGGVGI